MDIPVGNIVSVSDLQKDYRKIIDKAKRTNKPVLVMRGNNPEVVVLDVSVMNKMSKRLGELETEDTLKVIEEGRKEFKQGKTINWETLAAPFREYAKKRGLTDKDILKAIEESRNEKASDRK